MCSASQTSSGGEKVTRRIKGALVSFGDGARVSNVQLAHTSALVEDFNTQDALPDWTSAGFRTTNCRRIHVEWHNTHEDVPAYVKSLFAKVGKLEDVGIVYQNLALREQSLLFVEDGAAEVAARTHGRRHNVLDGIDLVVRVWSQIEVWIPLDVHKAIEGKLKELFNSWQEDTSDLLSSLKVEEIATKNQFFCVTLGGTSKKALAKAAVSVEALVDSQRKARDVADKSYESSIDCDNFINQDHSEIAIKHDDLSDCRANFIEGHSSIGTNNFNAESEAKCGLCGGLPVQATKLLCGHVYCFECFEHLCRMGPDMDNSDGSIQCIHTDTTTCSRAPALSELQRLLPPSIFEDVLEASFTSHVRRKVEKFGHCSSPDCTNIFGKVEPGDTKYLSGPNERAPAISCEACLEITCLACGRQHGGLTCAEFNYETSGETQALDEYKKAAEIKDCRNCGTSIQKSDGCNHMTCSQCASHICWVCEETYLSASECIDHLRQDHNGLGDGDAIGDEDNGVWQDEPMFEHGNGDGIEDAAANGLMNSNVEIYWRGAAGWNPIDWAHVLPNGLW